jgi:metallophosphoesterase (TIGR00282 family)
VVGSPGCRALFMGLPVLVKKTRADLVIANGENAADGLGLTPEIAGSLFKSGVEIITSGNHIWQKREILPLLETDGRVLRPENYPAGVPGKGHALLAKREVNVAVLNLQGLQHLPSIRCPFAVGSELARKLRAKARVVIVDFHAESPEEKEALALHLDGAVSAVLGTHTHVQTADERILTRGTAYIGDVGMTGPKLGVIGMKREISIRRSLTQIPIKMEVENSDGVIMGVLVEVNPDDGKAISIQRIAQDA